MEAAQGGDRAALDQLLRRHYDRIHAVCRRVTGSDADAADAAQEAMIAIVRGLRNFDGRSSFGTWVYRIATNASLDELRRRRRRPMVHTDLGDGRDGPGGPAHEAADPDSGVRLDNVSDRMAIDAALSQLGEEFRVPVVLRDLADLDYAEIAEVLDIPVGTVKSRIARGRAALAHLLSPTVLGEKDTEPGNQPPSSQRPNQRHE